ncbi:MAG: hypothetical protein FJZ47_02935 [Candidatus Tectomicrobia bacterium]|uniref:Novel STAND NTPase 1 domain-containing protein n=1 Tax=Tectimicrobiota bacterium TaxID=2528274 RepID=A0A937W018_UNCTE|nr:hypothetical protein [Candidatus Tectomicrobia bacterium]
MTATLQPPAPPSTQVEPYKGLRPYEEADKDAFFGREAECNILIDKILANRLTLLFAATGVGKSSLLQAAVLPRLKDPTREHLEVVYFRDWVADPLTDCQQTVLRVLQANGRLDPALRLEDVDHATLRDFLQFCALFTRPPLVLVLDQFEELFQYQRSRSTLHIFLQQLAEVLTDRTVPVAVVIAMREDFALELNALKPYLPTLLFENFYRLEHLDRANAEAAISKPVARLGWCYEPALLEALLTDLLSRELASRSATPVADMIDAVEPPYLQITCAELWRLEQRSEDRTLHLATYRQHGGAQGLLRTYITTVLADFSATDKRLASLAFNHMVTRRGTKMAYTAANLGSLIRAEAAPLGQVLERLATARILRSQSRQGTLWYELYHDLFSDIIEQWNERYKNQQRTRRAIIGAASALLSLAGLYAAYDLAVNLTNQHVRLSVREVSDAVDLYRGKAGSRDLFGVQHYLASTGYRRVQVEPDKLFVHKPIETFTRLNVELIGLLPLSERITAYWHSGQHAEALTLAKKAISDDNVQRGKDVIVRLQEFNTLPVLALLQERMQHVQSPYLKTDIARVLGTMRVPESTPVLVSRLHDPSADVRQRVVQALGQLGSAQALGPLLERLSDPDADVRQSVVEALGQLGSAQAVAPLLNRLQDQPEALRAGRLKAAGKLSPSLVRDAAMTVWAEPTVSRTLRSVAAALLLDADHAPSQQLLQDLAQSELVADRAVVAEALEAVPTAPGVPWPLHLLHDANARVQHRAIAALGVRQATEAVPALVGLLTTEAVVTPVGVQSAAVEALRQIATDASWRGLQTVVATPSLAIPVRRAALTTLGRSQTEHAVASLLKAVASDEPFLRFTAYQALGERRISEALPLLRAQLAALQAQQAQWRRIRDTARENFTPAEAEAWKQRVTAARPVPGWFFELAYAMARIDSEATGLGLLTHDSADVRAGAALGLGEVGSVPLVQRLHDLRGASRDPLHHQALYRAIDWILRRLEGVGSPGDLAALRVWLPQLPSDDPVQTRAEWTVLRLEEIHRAAAGPTPPPTP